MTKEKTARLIPNAIQVSTDTEKVTLDRLVPQSKPSLLMKVIPVE